MKFKNYKRAIGDCQEKIKVGRHVLSHSVVEKVAKPFILRM